MALVLRKAAQSVRAISSTPVARLSVTAVVRDITLQKHVFSRT